MSSAPYMSQSWRNWVQENITRGCPRMSIYDILRENGFGTGAIKMAMGEFFPETIAVDGEGRDASGRTLWHDAVSNCTITQSDDPRIKRIPSSKLQIYTIENFLSEEECAHIVELADTNVSKSTITTPEDSAGYDATYRTSETCFLHQMKDPLIEGLDGRMSEMLGIGTGWAEPIQAQRYQVGQEFKAHTDFFEPGTDEYKKFCSKMGQRTWTFMIYLNEGCEGGATRFRKIDRQFYPTTGMGVVWNSLTTEGDPNPFSLHHGMKVKEGSKYVITKWYRDRGNGSLFSKTEVEDTITLTS